MSIRPTAQIAALMSIAAVSMASAPQYVPREQTGFGSHGYAGTMKGRRGTWKPKKERNRKGASR